MSTYVDLTAMVFFKPDGSDRRPLQPRQARRGSVGHVPRRGMTYAVLTTSTYRDSASGRASTRLSVASVQPPTCRGLCHRLQKRGIVPACTTALRQPPRFAAARVRLSSSRPISNLPQALPFGSERRAAPRGRMIYTTSAVQSFQTAQLTELLSSTAKCWSLDSTPDSLGAATGPTVPGDGPPQPQIVVM